MEYDVVYIFKDLITEKYIILIIIIFQNYVKKSYVNSCCPCRNRNYSIC